MMSALLQLIDLCFSHSHRELFQRINLTVNDGDHIGLVGHNGSGKSTLLALVNGQEEADHGEIRKKRNLKIATVEQFLPTSLADKTLHSATLAVLPHEEQQIQSYRVDLILEQLGFDSSSFEIPVLGLSGGQQNLLLFARATLKDPELLLMDEPGNHMDIWAMTQLQTYLGSQTTCPFVLISHDRSLLNRVCNRTVFLRDQKLYQFDLPYESAREELIEQDANAEKARALEEKEISRLQASAKRLMNWHKVYDNEDLARKSKAIQRRADKLEAEKTFVSHGSGLKLELDSDKLNSKQVLAIDGLTIYTADEKRALLTIDQLVLKPGDRIALLGINGVGKSSTLNTIRAYFDGTKPPSDKIRFNPNTKLAFYDQELGELDSKESRYDWLIKRNSSDDRSVKMTLLNAGVPFDEFNRVVGNLSGGEKARMMFALFRLKRPNFLILDEPTNHIDLQGKEELEQELVQSECSLLITSHDREFVDRIANRYLLIDEEQLVEIHDPEIFYASLRGSDSRKNRKNALEDDSNVGGIETLNASEDELLELIVALEQKLQADQARKPKHQKPELQTRWQNELTVLYKKIEALE